MINVINKFNNSTTAKEIFRLLKRDKTIVDLGRGKYGSEINYSKSTKPTMLWNGTVLKFTENTLLTSGKNAVEFKKGLKLTPFDLLVFFKHGGNINFAITELKGLYNEKCDYIRVGTDYYNVTKIVDDDYGDSIEVFEKWNKVTINDDYGPAEVQRIPKYLKFFVEPDNINYRKSKNGMYNKYNEIHHKPIEFDVNGDLKEIEWTMRVIKHLFSDKWELGLEYFQILWINPKQILPILVFGSKERETGKSTINELIRYIFGFNSVEVSVKDMDSNFNGAIAEKLVVCIEEAESESKELVHTLKKLSTARRLLVDEKFIPKYEVDFYAKFFILTNEVKKFLRIDDKENRFMVNIVPQLKERNNNIYEELKKEVPYFIHYLQSLPVKGARNGSRMWFSEEEIYTEALTDVKIESKTALHSDVEEMLDDYCANDMSLKEEIKFTAGDIKMKFFHHDNHSLKRIGSILRDDMNLPVKDSACSYVNFHNESKKGKYFTYINPYYEENNQEEQEVPY